jgi:hypothetical protein
MIAFLETAVLIQSIIIGFLLFKILDLSKKKEDK